MQTFADRCPWPYCSLAMQCDPQNHGWLSRRCIDALKARLLAQKLRLNYHQILRFCVHYYHLPSISRIIYCVVNLKRRLDEQTLVAERDFGASRFFRDNHSLSSGLSLGAIEMHVCGKWSAIFPIIFKFFVAHFRQLG